MEHWIIIDRDGKPLPQEELPARPEDARAAEGEAFRPWYKEDEHIHVEEGRITGMHGRGSLESVQTRLRAYLAREADLLGHFGGMDDILVGDADAFLADA